MNRFVGVSVLSAVPLLALGSMAADEPHKIYECKDAKGEIVYQDDPCIEAPPAGANPKVATKPAAIAKPKAKAKTTFAAKPKAASKPEADALPWVAVIPTAPHPTVTPGPHYPVDPDGRRRRKRCERSSTRSNQATATSFFHA